MYYILFAYIDRDLDYCFCSSYDDMAHQSIPTPRRLRRGIATRTGSCNKTPPMSSNLLFVWNQQHIIPITRRGSVHYFCININTTNIPTPSITININTVLMTEWIARHLQRIPYVVIITATVLECFRY